VTQDYRNKPLVKKSKTSLRHAPYTPEHELTQNPTSRGWEDQIKNPQILEALKMTKSPTLGEIFMP